MAQVIRENVSPYVFDHSQELTNGTSFTKMAVNGYTFCNMRPGLISMQVRLAVLGLRWASLVSRYQLVWRRRSVCTPLHAARSGQRELAPAVEGQWRDDERK